MTRPARRRLTGLAGGVALAITVGVTPPAAAQTDDHAATRALLDQYRTKTGPGAAVYFGGGTLAEMPLSCGGVAWVKNGALPTGHTSITAVTDEEQFASLVTNTFATSEEASALSVGLLGSALCE